MVGIDYYGQSAAAQRLHFVNLPFVQNELQEIHSNLMRAQSQSHYYGIKVRKSETIYLRILTSNLVILNMFVYNWMKCSERLYIWYKMFSGGELLVWRRKCYFLQH